MWLLCGFAGTCVRARLEPRRGRTDQGEEVQEMRGGVRVDLRVSWSADGDNRVRIQLRLLQRGSSYSQEELPWNPFFFPAGLCLDLTRLFELCPIKPVYTRRLFFEKRLATLLGRWWHFAVKQKKVTTRCLIILFKRFYKKKIIRLGHS